jgi:Ni,Fe-hydrogenase III small subunit
MLQVLKQIARTGIKTEALPGPAREMVVTARLQQDILHILGRALTIRHVDAGSCNGCELEIHALGNPYYNIEGAGIRFVASPRHADMLLVTGPVSKHMAIALKRTYDATPDPKLVVAAGDCGCTGGIFGESYASLGGVASVIPVDIAIPGCPPSPTALLQGILAAVTAVAPRIEPSLARGSELAGTSVDGSTTRAELPATPVDGSRAQGELPLTPVDPASQLPLESRRDDSM